MKMKIQKDYMHCNFHGHLIYNSQQSEATCVHQQTNGKRLHKCTMDYYSAIKGMTFCHFQQCGLTERT